MAVEAWVLKRFDSAESVAFTFTLLVALKT